MNPITSIAKSILTRKGALIAALIAVGIAAVIYRPKSFEEADRDNDWKALVGDVKVYDACYDKQFQGDECAR